MTSIRVDESVISETVHAACSDLQTTAFHKGVDEAGKVYEIAYRNALLAAHKEGRKPGGKNFLPAFECVTRKTSDFREGIGSYCVVGIEMIGGRPKAPQARFDENGTEVRETAKGYNRGAAASRQWLASTMANWADQAKEAMLRTIQHNVDISNSSS